MTKEHPESKPDEAVIPKDKNEILRLIEVGRDILNDDQMELLFALYEEDDAWRAAEMLGMSLPQLEKKWLDVIGRTTPQPNGSERITKKGKPYLKRLGHSALTKILLERSDMVEEDRKIVIALATSTNQGTAARSLGMTYNDFVKRFIEIRREYDF
ncbi:MAG TPA: hypothetical protein PK096_01780 [Candidatus Saccharibacteria bacterium]|nr:hypothetical protein [Candidatus Saccharibacteria bacterium]HRK94076.1 hypothetical protein [Candidatus Saccharibacteria bacterium]